MVMSFRHLLLWSLSYLLKDFHSMLNSGCHGNQKQKLQKSYCEELLGHLFGTNIVLG